MQGLWKRILPFRSRVRKRRRSGTSQAGWWEHQWRQPALAVPYVGRPVSPEIVAAVRDGWLRRGGLALDAGCGEGVVADWLSRHGFQVLGVDIAPSAIERARALHGEREGLGFAVADLLREPPASPRPFDVVIDRGCFHQMRDRDLPAYTRNLHACCAADARMLIFSRAYRDGIAYGDARERERVVGRVQRAYAGRFELERVADTWLDRDLGAHPENALGGIALWLRRTGGGARAEAAATRP